MNPLVLDYNFKYQSEILYLVQVYTYKRYYKLKSYL
jgi:hypothetical protein